MKSLLTLTTKKILAGAVPLRVAITGDYFYCKSATVPFKMAFDSNLEVDMDAGWSLRESFNNVTIRNTTDALLVVEFWTAAGEVHYDPPALRRNWRELVVSTDQANVAQALSATPIYTDQAFILSNSDIDVTLKLNGGTATRVLAPGDERQFMSPNGRFDLSAWTMTAAGINKSLSIFYLE